MKKLLFIGLIFLQSIVLFSQVKVFTGGNVSIGSTSTSTAIEKLHVFGNIFIPNGKSLWIGSNNETNGDRLRLHHSSTSAYIDYATGPLYFRAGTTTKVTLDANGNMGIGTSSLTQKLEINGNAIINGADKRLYFANTQYRYVGMANSSDLGLINKESTWLRIASLNGMAFFSNHSTPETSSTGFKMFINNYGVSIGGGYAYSPFTFVVYGRALNYSNTWETSDVQFKDNITDISSPLVKINQISGKKYKYKTDQFPELNFPDGYTYGVIAQEVGQVFPELVIEDSKGYKAVNYTGLIPIMIEAIKAQQQQILQLQSDLTDCCSKPKSNQKSMNNGNPENESQGNLQGMDTRTNNSENPKLYQNIPNPFNTRTEIKYYLPEKSIKAAILIFDMQGKLLKTNNLMNKGNGSLEIFGGELNPGMYMYSLIIDGNEIDTKRMILTEL